MKRLLWLIPFVLCGTLWAEGPRFIHKDTFVNQEFENVYQDIRATKGAFTYDAGETCIDDPTFCVDTVNNYLTQSSTTISGSLTVRSTSSFTGAATFNAALTFTTASGTSLTTTSSVTASALVLTVDPSTTPVAHTLYKANIIKGWINYSGVTNNISDSFNVSSITDNGGVGDHTVNWDRNFANSSYAAACLSQSIHCSLNANLGEGTTRVRTLNSSHAQEDTNPVLVIAVGDQ